MNYICSIFRFQYFKPSTRVGEKWIRTLHMRDFRNFIAQSWVININNACGIIFCFSKVSYSVHRSFNQPTLTETSFLLLDFSFRKDLVHYVAQILLFPVTWELFRHSAADITLRGPLEHHPTLGHKWVTHSPSHSEQVRWCEETAIAGYIYPKHLHFLKDKHYI